jgi:hypothetical protein
MTLCRVTLRFLDPVWDLKPAPDRQMWEKRRFTGTLSLASESSEAAPETEVSRPSRLWKIRQPPTSPPK